MDQTIPTRALASIPTQRAESGELRSGARILLSSKEIIRRIYIETYKHLEKKKQDLLRNNISKEYIELFILPLNRNIQVYLSSKLNDLTTQNVETKCESILIKWLAYEVFLSSSYRMDIQKYKKKMSDIRKLEEIKNNGMLECRLKALQVRESVLEDELESKVKQLEENVTENLIEQNKQLKRENGKLKKRIFLMKRLTKKKNDENSKLKHLISTDATVFLSSYDVFQSLTALK
uniref:Uncharacterized protein n=1 Tax=viral metagenome TaxID=1070528 RepID=A0A6C0JQG5_9ZZZZ